MTDLVERLRERLIDIESEAADEIERLRAQGDVLFASIKSNADEIERLRDPNSWGFDHLVAMAKRILDLKYPADIFDGSSGDLGPDFVVRLRATIEELEHR